MTAAEARARFRSGLVTPTSGLAPGHTQANLIAVPADCAYDVLLFAQRNPKPCPILDVTDAGVPHTALAPGADLPSYRVWINGSLATECPDATPFWRDDLVAVLIGCSFTFESFLLAAGIPLRGSSVPMYLTSRPCRPTPRLRGPLVVSMRPIPADLVPTAVDVTRLMPAVHGSPVHIGDPSALGIADLSRPDFGTPVDLLPGEVPVFWACGVTPQAAVMASHPRYLFRSS